MMSCFIEPVPDAVGCHSFIHYILTSKSQNAVECRMTVKVSRYSIVIEHPYYEVIVTESRGSVRKLVVVTSVAKTVMLFMLRREERI